MPSEDAGDVDEIAGLGASVILDEGAINGIVVALRSRVLLAGICTGSTHHFAHVWELCIRIALAPGVLHLDADEAHEYQERPEYNDPPCTDIALCVRSFAVSATRCFCSEST